MVHRCQHYTCIVTWSLGNESGYGPNHEACAALVRSVDATRPLQYEGGRQHDDAVFILGTGHGPKTGTRLLLWWCLFFVLSKNDMLCILIFSFSPFLLVSFSPFFGPSDGLHLPHVPFTRRVVVGLDGSQ